MQKKITIIRNLELVEKELNSATAGVISVSLQKTKFDQYATNFVYQDKNIFIFIDDDELLRSIKFDSLSRFTVLKQKTMKDKAESIYQLSSIQVTGNLREAEEKKVINDITQSYIQKYTGKLILPDDKSASMGKLVFIDSEELLAFEEIGY
ncbi:MAG: hypothetical protein KJO12_09290 [Ignavibacteria bacterium]|nr:hypothetical protein [Ignavibacteria bacterium]